MPKSWGGKKVEKRLADTRREHWPDERPWMSEKEVGYFPVPRTLPMVLGLLNMKKMSGVQDLGPTYLELFSRHTGQGIVHMDPYEEHAFRAGYYSDRGKRTWQERMNASESLGFIKAVPAGPKRYGIVLLVHPTLAVGRLREQNLIDDGWWNLYRAEQRQTGEPTYEELVAELAAAKRAEEAAAS